MEGQRETNFFEGLQYLNGGLDVVGVQRAGDWRNGDSDWWSEVIRRDVDGEVEG